ncbi:MAG: helix-turn-helix transcriptional regulator [bacterium]|nr:helix-turn-helix transcriptional regulator [bacterium]
MDTQTIRIRLIKKNLRVKDLSVKTGIDYDRLEKILNNYRPAREEEVRAIARVLELDESELGGSS